MKANTAELTSFRKVMIMLVLILATIVPMGDLVIIPAANAIYFHFNQVNIGILNFILSGPALIAVFVAPFVGRGMNRIGKKRMLLIGMAFFTVGAVLGGIVENALYMAVMRGIVGIAVGIVSPTCMAIIADIFANDKKKLGTMMGFWNAGMSSIGALVSLIAGMLVAFNWRYIFLIYLIALPIILLICIFLPGKSSDEVVANATSISLEPMPWKSVLTMYISYFLGELLLCVMYYEISIYMAELNLGGSMIAGVLSTVMTLGTCGACLIFGLLYARFQLFLPGLVHFLIASAYFLFAFFPSAVFATIGMVLIGIGNGLIMSYYQTHLAVIVPKSQVSFALGISASVLGVAMFFCTYFCTFLRVVTDGSIISVCCILFILSLTASILGFGKEWFGRKGKIEKDS